MLTSEQNQKLFQLMENCQIEKLKPILYCTIPKYISGEIEPTQCTYGISSVKNEFNLFLWGNYYSPRNCACLIGTSLIGKKRESDPQSDSQFYFNINEYERRTIERAFDNILVNFDEQDSEQIKWKMIYDYIEEIRKVIFGE